MDKRLDDLGRAVESLRSDLNSLRSEMNGRFNNIYVLIGASWVTLIGAMIGLYFK